MAALGKFFLAILALAWSAVLGGYMLSILWGWFVVGLFGLPALGVAQAIGLKMTFGVLKGVNLIKKTNDKPFNEQMLSMFFGLLLFYGSVLLIAYIVKQFV